MNTLTITQPAHNDILAMIDANPKLQPTTKAQYKKAIGNYLDTGNRLTVVHQNIVHKSKWITVKRSCTEP